ncbi:Peptide methionine sulfoxide reductase MsrA [Hartmannibacter diazotrophicus]|uniref:Peptide methionine sulfoxide reductase MsrA n=1 Tax=Hartmannibacter diazotrophicus TaxID=1482074 RepID=A0A2C9D4G1_9HYPH|nr:peptide-methionine (S)-S-oxide reductase MsrA [Hartmannibacter diazotrophicus]SON55113.1 Peptide methionine sulfoxide reductase MsrA [Hartmannibacter diazotrophicus]
MRPIHFIRGALLLAAALVLGAAPAAAASKTAVFAGGCFWCVEADFDHVPGVLKTTSGYIGGTVENPSYKQVSAGGTGHYEAVEITYDPSKVSYDALVTYFFHSVDPLDAHGQFCDRGDSYRTAIFVGNGEERSVAEAAKAAAHKVLGRKIATKIIDRPTFYPAEQYHQGYYEKNPIRYRYYRTRCGRDQRVKSLWGKSALSLAPAS